MLEHSNLNYLNEYLTCDSIMLCNDMYYCIIYVWHIWMCKKCIQLTHIKRGSTPMYWKFTLCFALWPYVSLTWFGECAVTFIHWWWLHNDCTQWKLHAATHVDMTGGEDPPPPPINANNGQCHTPPTPTMAHHQHQWQPTTSTHNGPPPPHQHWQWPTTPPTNDDDNPQCSVTTVEHHTPPMVNTAPTHSNNSSPTPSWMAASTVFLPYG